MQDNGTIITTPTFAKITAIMPNSVLHVFKLERSVKKICGRTLLPLLMSSEMEHVSCVSSDVRGISNRVSPVAIGDDAIMP